MRARALKRRQFLTAVEGWFIRRRLSKFERRPPVPRYRSHSPAFGYCNRYNVFQARNLRNWFIDLIIRFAYCWPAVTLLCRSYCGAVCRSYRERVQNAKPMDKATGAFDSCQIRRCGRRLHWNAIEWQVRVALVKESGLRVQAIFVSFFLCSHCGMATENTLSSFSSAALDTSPGGHLG